MDLGMKEPTVTEQIPELKDFDPTQPSEDGWHRHPLRIPPFIAVIGIVEVLDLVLTTRVEKIVSTQVSAISTITRAISVGGNIVFACLLIFGVYQVIHHHVQLAREATPRFALPVMLAYLSVASTNIFINMFALIITPDLTQTSQSGLMFDLGLLFASNMLVFSLWYQVSDAYLRGGAFDFPPNAAHPNDSPRWIDYLSLSFMTQATFGPTLEGVRTRPPKVLMMIQTSMSLIVLVVLIARIIKAPV